MTREELQGIRRRFHRLAAEYERRTADPQRREMMALKRVHSAFVARNARAIAERLGWSEADTNAAEALGWLHDVGRFPQLEEYGTFRDADSIDHGERGRRLIEEEGWLDGISPPALRDALLDAVEHHNDRTPPPDLPCAHYPWLRLIRDADRLDIYRVVLEAFESGRIREQPELVFDLPLDDPPSPELAERIARGEAPAYSELKSAADFLLMLLSWIFRMNYPAALEIIRSRGDIDRFAALLDERDPVVKKVLDVVRRRVSGSL